MKRSFSEFILLVDIGLAIQLIEFVSGVIIFERTACNPGNSIKLVGTALSARHCQIMQKAFANVICLFYPAKISPAAPVTVFNIIYVFLGERRG